MRLVTCPYRRVVQCMAAFLLCFAAACLQAQMSVGAISGAVKDSTGASIPGATIVVTNSETGTSQTVTADGSGFYSVEGVVVGTYEVKVMQQGFREALTENVQVGPGQRRSVDIALAMGSTSETVTVTADTDQVNVESSESGGTLSSKQIENLMLNGRNFQTLALAIPGVSGSQGSDQITPSALGTAATLIINGTSVEYSTYTIDGIYDMDSGSLGTFNVVPIVDGIQEFSVLKDNYSAKYGLTGSGQVVVVTKAGTDTYHGTGWEYLRNDYFDSDNFFSTAKQSLRQNVFGYSLGGPVSIPHLYDGTKKKTFFFASNQWYKINAGSLLRGAVFPQAMRDGNLTDSPTLGGALTLDANSEKLLASKGLVNCIASATTLNPACIDPVAVGILNAIVPLPNNPGGGFLNYINQLPATTTQNDYQYRVDHALTSKHTITPRMMYQTIENAFPYNAWSFGAAPYSTMPSSWYQTAWNGLVRVQSTWTPSFLNTFSFGFTNDRQKIHLADGVGALPSGLTIKQAFPNAPTRGLIPNISIAGGWSGNGVFSQPIEASDGEGILMDDVSLVRGRHVIQTGFMNIWGIKRQTVFTTPQGAFSFSGVHTGDPAADYLLGLDTTYSQTNTEPKGNFHYRQWEAYLQDDWKATSRLTLNMGLRWQYFPTNG